MEKLRAGVKVVFSLAGGLIMDEDSSLTPPVVFMVPTGFFSWMTLTQAPGTMCSSQRLTSSLSRMRPQQVMRRLSLGISKAQPTLVLSSPAVVVPDTVNWRAVPICTKMEKWLYLSSSRCDRSIKCRIEDCTKFSEPIVPVDCPIGVPRWISSWLPLSTPVIFWISYLSWATVVDGCLNRMLPVLSVFLIVILIGWACEELASLLATMAQLSRYGYTVGPITGRPSWSYSCTYWHCPLAARARTWDLS